MGISGTESIAYIYHKQSVSPPYISMLSSRELQSVKRMRDALGEKVLNPELVKQEWRKLSFIVAPQMLYSLGGFSGYLLRIFRKLGLHKHLYKGKSSLAALNLLRGQTHRELLEEYFDIIKHH